MNNAPAPLKTHVDVTTLDKAVINVYDVESLHNAFTVAFYTDADPAHNNTALVEIFYWVDFDDRTPGYTLSDIEEQALRAHILRINPTLDPNAVIATYNLATNPVTNPNAQANNELLAQRLAASSEDDITNPKRTFDRKAGVYRFENIFGTPPIVDVMQVHDPTVHPYLAGFNSRDYDLTMLSFYLGLVFDYRVANTAEQESLQEQFGDHAVFVGGRRPHGVDANGNVVYQSIYDTNANPRTIREFNDHLFTVDGAMSSAFYDRNAYRSGITDKMRQIRRNFLSSGRHIDIAKLNERQQRTALKRLTGMLGHKILESAQLDDAHATLTTLEQFFDLIAYNVSDVINTRLLLDHPLYAGSFDLRARLLNTYPETVFSQQYLANPYHANVLKRMRMTVDSSSAQFVANVLAPYAPLKDIPAVSFNYPTQQRCDEINATRPDPATHIAPFNVLELAKQVICKQFPDNANPRHVHIRDQFQRVYDYYNAIQYNNFNTNQTSDGKEHTDPITGHTYVIKDYQSLRDIPGAHTNLYYYHENGQASSGFATFSTGGIHGAEYNYAAYKQDFDRTAYGYALLDAAKQECAHDAEIMREQRDITVSFTWIDASSTTHEETDVAVNYTDVLKPKRKSDPQIWRDIPKGMRPATIFQEKTDGTTKLNPAYVYTSAQSCEHEDFTSYYPLLLRNLSAFYNPDLGEDRYSVIFQQKEDYDVLRKDQSKTPQEREMYSVLREGTKLVLNTASGAGDANHNNNIRMNNRVISMRIIGQLFSWIIGQEQTYRGATIISTNTDGLYSAGLTPEENQAVLDKWADKIQVQIEPEHMFLISKDSNNRIELGDTTDLAPGELPVVYSASGGTLGCWRGPNPGQALSHPAMIDRILVEYLRNIAARTINPDTGNPLSLNEPFSCNLARDIVARLHEECDTPQLLLLYQTMINASRGSRSFPYALPLRYNADGDIIPATDEAQYHETDAAYGVDPQHPTMPTIIQHNNRIFFTTAPDPNTPFKEHGRVVLARGTAKTISKTMSETRKRNDRDTHVVENWATYVLQNNGFDARATMQEGNYGKDIITQKITKIEDTTPIIIANQSVYHDDDPSATHTRQEILDAIDTEHYIAMAQATFNTNWLNEA